MLLFDSATCVGKSTASFLHPLPVSNTSTTKETAQETYVQLLLGFSLCQCKITNFHTDIRFYELASEVRLITDFHCFLRVYNWQNLRLLANRAFPILLKFFHAASGLSKILFTWLNIEFVLIDVNNSGASETFGDILNNTSKDFDFLLVFTVK